MYYSKDHEWLKIENNQATIGITNFASEHLGDITFVELPKIGKKLKQFEIIGTIESVKAVSDIYSPISGEVIEVNSQLEQAPELVNQDPENQAWLAKLKIESQEETKNLMNQVDYSSYLKGL